MAPRKKAVKKFNAVAASTDITACDPPLNEDGTDKFGQPDVQSETDIRDTENCYVQASSRSTCHVDLESKH